MDNEQLLDLLQNKPKGLLEQLKYFEYELAKLEEQKGNSKIKRRIRSEIDNLRHDISVFDEILNESKESLESSFYEGQKLSDETISMVNSGLDNLPKKKVYGYAVFTGVSLSLLITSLYSQDYILLIASLLLLVSAYRFYKKSTFHQLERGSKITNRAVEMMNLIDKKIEQIEAVKQEIFFAQKRQKNNVYGTHQERRSWLEENFNALKNGSIKIEDIANDETLVEIKKIKGEEGSDNLIAKQLAEVYFEKFNSIISHDQIKGMVIYKNR